MDNKTLFEIMNQNPAFTLATCEGDEPRVRTMFLYKADGDGIVFHTGPMKEVYRQIEANPKVQLCFYDAKAGVQVRVRGTLEKSDDIALKEEISSHPSRAFMKAWMADGKSKEDFYKMFSVFTLKGGIANVWTFMTNFAPKEDVLL
ncbi:MAG: pyridoxamine 5'-phosphate oxidase family protein [Firmicutes bacterium]|nr:pyridoxamine 5'-phosphate oxidase family protein [Bacillota bacterium]